MIKKYLFLGILVFSLFRISALSICIDRDVPTWENATFTLSSDFRTITLNWNAAIDEPSCSGISYYDIYRNGNFLTKVSSTTYTETVSDYGTYEYVIYAIDRIGHNEGLGILNSISISSEGNFGVSKRSSTSYWRCGKWDLCNGTFQIRTCLNMHDATATRTETRECSENQIFDLISETRNARINLTEENKNKLEGQQSSSNFITGAAADIGDFVKSGTGAVTLSGLIILTVLTISIITIKRNKKIIEKY